MSDCEKCWADALVMSRTSFLDNEECYKKILEERMYEHKCSDVERAGMFWSEEYGIDKRSMQTMQPYYLEYLKSTKDNREIRSSFNYISWITGKHREFQKEGNDKRVAGYSDLFLSWLKNKAN